MNIGFISTRFCGTDGVTLETSKWAQIFHRNGYKCFWFAGELDRDPSTSYLAPEAHFQSDVNIAINDVVIGTTHRNSETTELIQSQRMLLKKHIYRFLQKYDIDIIVAQNILCLPMQIPLGLALSEVIAETRIPTIAHHHDFYWERDRYLVNAVEDYLLTAFPPNLPNIAHVVINSAAREELARRTGIEATVAPNVLDFHQSPPIDTDVARSFRDYIGARPQDWVFLQPTRVVQRKGIEHAINLVNSMGRPNCKLVISHMAGDEGFEYAQWLERYAKTLEVDLIFMDAHLDDPWGTHKQHSCRYPEFCLFDIYPGADFVTYPSLCEGFGNGLLEAIYFKKPVLINRYATYVKDIEPLGFNFVSIDGFITPQAVEQVNQLLTTSYKYRQVTEHNYQIAKEHFSYETLQNCLNAALTELFGDNYSRLTDDISSSNAYIINTESDAQSVSLEEFEQAKAYN